MVVGKIIDLTYVLSTRCPRCNKKITKTIESSKLPKGNSKHEYTCWNCGLFITEKITDIEWDEE